MKERISKLTNDNQAKSIWMGTFHSVFARILRSESELIGFPPNFTIYDSYDSEKLISNIIKEMNLNKDFYKAKKNYSKSKYDYLISKLKLKQSIGTLSIDDLKVVNSWLN